MKKNTIVAAVITIITNMIILMIMIMAITITIRDILIESDTAII